MAQQLVVANKVVTIELDAVRLNGEAIVRPNDRRTVNSASNPDPYTNGLVITAAETASLDWVIPWANPSPNPEFEFEGFTSDPNGVIYWYNHPTIPNSKGSFSVAVKGIYEVGLSLAFLTFIDSLPAPSLNSLINVQLMREEHNLFSAPPILFSFAPTVDASTMPPPLNAIAFAGNSFIGSTNVVLNPGQKYNVKLFTSVNTVSMQVVSAITVRLINRQVLL
jgi:hypothetical protein